LGLIPLKFGAQNTKIRDLICVQLPELTANGTRYRQKEQGVENCKYSARW